MLWRLPSWFQKDWSEAAEVAVIGRWFQSYSPRLEIWSAKTRYSGDGYALHHFSIHVPFVQFYPGKIKFPPKTTMAFLKFIFKWQVIDEDLESYRFTNSNCETTTMKLRLDLDLPSGFHHVRCPSSTVRPGQVGGLGGDLDDEVSPR